MEFPGTARSFLAKLAIVKQTLMNDRAQSTLLLTQRGQLLADGIAILQQSPTNTAKTHNSKAK